MKLAASQIYDIKRKISYLSQYQIDSIDKKNINEIKYKT